MKSITKYLVSIFTFALISIAFNHPLLSQTSNTAIFDWGDDTFNQLYAPFEKTNISNISTGYEHTLAIQENSVIGWGDNSYGQLDIPIDSLINPVKVSAGLGHSLVLLQDGTVVAWGFNEFGQTNVSSYNNIIDISTGDEHSALLQSDGTVIIASDSNATYDLTPPAGLSGVVSIASGNFHVVALKNDGTVVSWGANEFNQIDVPLNLKNVTQIGAGHFHSIALKNDGTVVGWGDDELFDQISVPSISSFYDISVGSYHNIAIYGSDNLAAWGSNRFRETEVPEILTGRTISLITSGFAHNTVIASNQAPTSIVVNDTIYVPEDVDKQTLLATLYTKDPDKVEGHLYRLVSGLGDEDNDKFSASCEVNKLTVHDDGLWGQFANIDFLINLIEFDYEQDSLYHVRIQSTDVGGLSIEKPVVVAIQNVNEEPDSLILSSDTIPEQAPLGTYIGDFSTRDPDLYDRFTYSLVEGKGGEDNEHFYINGNQLYSNNTFLAAEKNVRLIRVKSTDSGGISIEETFAIHIIPRNEAPLELILSDSLMFDDLGIGDLIGFFSTTDPDWEDTHEYTFVDDAENLDNSSFSIYGEALLLNTVLDSASKDSYRIRVQTMDNGAPENLSLTSDFVLAVLSSNTAPIVEDQVFNIEENVPASTQIGVIDALDDGALLYHIVDDRYTDIFALDSIKGILTVKDNSALDALTTPFYEFTVSVKDIPGKFAEANIRINIIYVPGVPVVEDQSFDLNENSIEGTKIGEFIAFSPKENPLTLSIIDGNEEGLFEITDDGSLTFIKSGTLDGRQTPTYLLNIRVSDPKESLSSEARAIINIIDFNKEPMNILLDNSSVDEQQAIGTKVGILSTQDSDFGDSHSYNIVGEENTFSIVENILVTNTVLDTRQRQSYTIRIQSTDNGTPALSREEDFTITVNSLELPEIPTAFTPNGDGVNDNWVIKNLDLYPQCTVQVFDQSGRSIFFSDGYRNPWSGKKSGSTLPLASYYYVIVLNDLVATKYTGLVTILK